MPPNTEAPVRLLIEEDSLTELAKQAVSDAYDTALDLESLGTFGKDALNETFHILTPEDLREKASRLRCIAQEGQRLSAELHRIAGQFEALGRVLASSPGAQDL